MCSNRKRKRSTPALTHSPLCPNQGKSSTALELTHQNLLEHQQDSGGFDEEVRDVRRKTSSDASDADTSTSSASYSRPVQATGFGLMAKQLMSLRIFYDDQPDMIVSDGIQSLYTTITADYQISPNSKKTSEDLTKINVHTKEMAEVDALRTLEEYFGYRPEVSVGGDGSIGISRAQDQIWRSECIPIPQPPDTETRTALGVALGKLGLPRAPKPDVCYGYTATAFSKPQALCLDGLESSPAAVDSTKVVPALMPFLITEWKSLVNGGNMHYASLQAARDAAAAININENFFHSIGSSTILPEATSVFTLCVDSEGFKLRVHWRHQDRDVVSWYAKVICRGYLDAVNDVACVRMYLRRILDWARGPRLEKIKSSLDAYIEARSSSQSQTVDAPATPSSSTSRSKRRKVQR